MNENIMRYEINGISDKWESATCDALSDAMTRAMEWIAADWRQVTIRGDDGSALNERQIREIHAVVQSAAMKA